MGSSLCLFGAVARRDFGPQLTKGFLDFLARCIGHGRNRASLIRRQLSGGHDDALDVRARLGENALHVKFFAHGFLLCGRAAIPCHCSRRRGIRMFGEKINRSSARTTSSSCSLGSPASASATSSSSRSKSREKTKFAKSSVAMAGAASLDSFSRGGK